MINHYQCSDSAKAIALAIEANSNRIVASTCASWVTAEDVTVCLRSMQIATSVNFTARDVDLALLMLKIPCAKVIKTRVFHLPSASSESCVTPDGFSPGSVITGFRAKGSQKQKDYPHNQ